MSAFFLPVAPTLMALTTTLVSLAKTTSTSAHSDFFAARTGKGGPREKGSVQWRRETGKAQGFDQSETTDVPSNVWRRNADDAWMNDPVSMQLVGSPLPKVSNATASGAHMDLDIEIDIQLLPTNYYDMTTVSSPARHLQLLALGAPGLLKCHSPACPMVSIRGRHSGNGICSLDGKGGRAAPQIGLNKCGPRAPWSRAT